jgi:hypothetical protein
MKERDGAPLVQALSRAWAKEMVTETAMAKARLAGRARRVVRTTCS